MSKQTAGLGVMGGLAVLLVALWVFAPAGQQIVQSAGMLALCALAAVGAFGLLSGIFAVPSLPLPRPGSGQLADYCSNLADGLLLAGPDGTPSFSNQAFWLHLGQTNSGARTVDPSQMLSFLAGGSEAAYRLSRAAAQGKNWEEVIEQPPVAGGAGASRWLRVAVEFGGGGSSSTYAAWRVHDITSEHAGRNEVLNKTKRGAGFAGLLAVGVVTSGPDHKDFHINATLAGWLAIEPSIAESRSYRLEQLISPASQAKLAAELGAHSGSPTIMLEVDLQLPGGVLVPKLLLAKAQPGSQQLAAGLLLNPASRKPAKSLTQAAEVQFTQLFHAAPIAIATMDADGRIGSANLAFAKMFFGSLPSQAADGREMLGRLHEDSRSIVRRALQSVGRAEPPVPPIDIIMGDGTRRSGQLFLSSNPESGGDRDCVIGFALDTTERKELEAQFAQSQKMQAIGQLAGGIAHDINNVLTVIIGFSDLLLANSVGDPAFQDLSEIKANANRAANLVRQLLAFSRRQTLRPEILSLNEVISDLTVFLKRSLGEKVKLERDYGRDLWLVRADQTELGRVFVNLAVNAVDAMPNGGSLTIRTVNVTRKESAALGLTGFTPGDYVMCQVIDTGHGMPADIIEKIFEPFFTTKDVGKGTGLGLSTVYGIVKQTGGYIYCESTPGAGTSFRIFLPRHVAGAGSVDLQSKVERKEKPRDLTGSGTVLLVEDEESVRRFAARALRRQGYAVLEAGNGQEALEVKAAHNGTIDLVVSDIVMPEMDGPTLLKELRKTNAGLRFIFMSGYADDALSSLDSGEEFAFLSKPFQLTELVTAVKELMSR